MSVARRQLPHIFCTDLGAFTLAGQSETEQDLPENW